MAIQPSSFVSNGASAKKEGGKPLLNILIIIIIKKKKKCMVSVNSLMNQECD